MTSPTAPTARPAARDVDAARRLLALGAAASAADVEGARAALLAAVRVPPGEPELTPVAERLVGRIVHAGDVLLAEIVACNVSPLPPMPPAEPVSVPLPRSRPDPGWATVGAATQPGPPRSRLRRGMPYIALVAALAGLLVSGLVWLGRDPAEAARPLPASTAPPPTIAEPVITPTFTERLVAGELGRSPTGLPAPSPEAALATLLAAAETGDGATVRLGLDEQSRLMDVAEIVVTFGAVPAGDLTCRRVGSSTFSCYPSRAGVHRAEVVHTASGWRVRGWIG